MRAAHACRAAAAILALAPVLARAQAGVAPKPKLEAGPGDACVACHATITPTIVSDWKLSKHAKNGLACDTCHGAEHRSKDDVARVKLPTPETCAACHAAQVEQFKRGKHAFAWAAMKAMPTFHYQPMALIEGQKGCGGCHKLGLKSEADLREAKRGSGGFGHASCDACHTRHAFSTAEARSPQACQTCHMGFDHPQWEMYSGSKHGVRSELKQKGVLPADAGAPTCQTCHMQGGNHEVRTAWGFLAVRLPMPEDRQWAADQTVILQALGVLDPDGKPTPRLDVVKAAQVARVTQEEFDAARKPMLETCGRCHASSFVATQFRNAEELIREADHLMAEGIREVAALYRDGLLQKPKDYAYAFPDLLTFHDAPTVPEQKLFVMFLEHRMRTFQGAFHMNPDYSLWYGWSEMVRDLAEIREAARDLRERRAAKPASAPGKKAR
ncbi:MAG TPA: multiheme c-type cytochrome [Anaeromyxobacteraceae bacterium]|nr:multiheme c-type cytochrome [Anaeromyxobacteraceae bacterium]